MVTASITKCVLWRFLIRILVNLTTLIYLVRAQIIYLPLNKNYLRNENEYVFYIYVPAPDIFNIYFPYCILNPSVDDQKQLA